MNKKLKLYNYIVKDFIDRYCDFHISEYFKHFVVSMYIDQIGDVTEPWEFTETDLKQDIRNKNSRKIITEREPYYKSMKKILSGYGLYDQEMMMVGELISIEQVRRLEELNKTLE